MQLVKEVIAEAEGQVVDAISTLKTLQTAVKSGSEVIINGKTVFKMPFINLVTFVEGGKLELPRGEMLADMDILIDGNPLEILYKDAPIIKPRIDTRTPEEIEAEKRAWQDRWGPGGGVDTWRGRYTGD